MYDCLREREKEGERVCMFVRGVRFTCLGSVQGAFGAKYIHDVERELCGSGKRDLASGQTQGEPITSWVCMGKKISTWVL